MNNKKSLRYAFKSMNTIIRHGTLWHNFNIQSANRRNLKMFISQLSNERTSDSRIINVASLHSLSASPKNEKKIFVLSSIFLSKYLHNERKTSSSLEPKITRSFLIFVFIPFKAITGRHVERAFVCRTKSRPIYIQIFDSKLHRRASDHKFCFKAEVICSR